MVTTSSCSLLLVYRPRKDERLSWPSWLTYSGRFTRISGHPSAVGRAQDSKSSSPVKDQRSTAVPWNQPFSLCSVCTVRMAVERRGERPTKHHVKLYLSHLRWSQFPGNSRKLHFLHFGNAAVVCSIYMCCVTGSSWSLSCVCFHFIDSWFCILDTQLLLMNLIHVWNCVILLKL